MFDWNYWLELFEARARNLVIRRPPPEDRLSNAERVRIGNSLGTFQLGEQSEGRTLQSFAERFAARRGIAELPAVTALFIKEEQHHAAQLAEFMRANAIPLKRRNWTDSVFRRIRKLAGYEAAVTILVTAEMIGFVYYRALARATDWARCRGNWSRSLAESSVPPLSVAMRRSTSALRRGSVSSRSAPPTSIQSCTVPSRWLPRRTSASTRNRPL